MIYTFFTVPQGEPSDFSKCFDPLSTSPTIAQKVNQILQLRNNFYGYLGKLTTRNISEYSGSVEWMPLMEYLNKGADLLEIGVKHANYPFKFNYAPFTSPDKTISITNGKFIITLDNEISCTMEIIFSRYLYALGISKSISGHIVQLRKATLGKNEESCKENLKGIMERMSNAAVRLYKMKAQERFIFVKLI